MPKSFTVLMLKVVLSWGPEDAFEEQCIGT